MCVLPKRQEHIGIITTHKIHKESNQGDAGSIYLFDDGVTTDEKQECGR